jgi:hypothetical protein
MAASLASLAASHHIVLQTVIPFLYSIFVLPQVYDVWTPVLTQHHGDIPKAKFFIAGRNMNERLRVLGY